MLTNAHQGCGIVHFSTEETNKLEKICEIRMIKKLGLRQFFPRELLHAKKDALGAGLIEPQTAVDLLAIKLCIGNKRGENELRNIINMHEDMNYWASGLLRGSKKAQVKYGTRTMVG